MSRAYVERRRVAQRDDMNRVWPWVTRPGLDILRASLTLLPMTTPKILVPSLLVLGAVMAAPSMALGAPVISSSERPHAKCNDGNKSRLADPKCNSDQGIVATPQCGGDDEKKPKS